jgi:hypothetical protein
MHILSLFLVELHQHMEHINTPELPIASQHANYRSKKYGQDLMSKMTYSISGSGAHNRKFQYITGAILN